ncbi:MULTISPECIES: hypothetical protein [Serratia]|uniref:hypothetical protein n=1 Tax=Serratia TaxID=613 RepID=UPI00139192C4|nr:MULTISPECIES: hypothetical protein [Serratia]MBJ7891941.1 hypothetical protein [Serratia sp. PAMC26656]UTN99284.1 hypothetical protein NLX81_04770 [Serratia plymuthica]
MKHQSHRASQNCPFKKHHKAPVKLRPGILTDRISKIKLYLIYPRSFSHLIATWLSLTVGKEYHFVGPVPGAQPTDLPIPRLSENSAIMEVSAALADLRL